MSSLLQFKDFSDTTKAIEILKSIIYNITYQYQVVPEQNSLEFTNVADAYDVQELLNAHGITTLNKFGRKTKTYYKFALKDTYTVKDNIKKKKFKSILGALKYLQDNYRNEEYKFYIEVYQNNKCSDCILLDDIK